MATRDLLSLALLILVFVVLVKVWRYRGNLTLYTCIVILFAIGQLAQYRLFSDPEYTGRGAQKSAARLSKAQAIRSRAVAQEYDRAKIAYVFGDAAISLESENPESGSDGNKRSEALKEVARVMQLPQPAREPSVAVGLTQVLLSARTWAPILSVLALMVACWFVCRETMLLRVQRHGLMIAVATLLPLMIIVVFFTRDGKFIGGMTPWEPAKVLFLLSLSSILVDSYRPLSKTRWGVPPMRFLLPLIVTAGCGLVPFFVLGDFGQLWVFSIVYAVLYLVAVKRPGQLIPGLLILVAVFVLLSSVGGIPERVIYRYYLWRQTWQPPPETAQWWTPYLEDIRKQYGAAASVTNEDAWFDKGSQLIQAIFGISRGQLVGAGFGLGLPEIVPVADSDFIYSTIAEELGWIGGASLLFVFLLLGAAGWREAMLATDMYTKLLAAGATAFLLAQAWVNVAGVVKLVPMTGITLPFVSHGGWSLLTSFTMVGILLGISQRNALQLNPPSQP
ncbi:MAG: FtsW/RodA/SpoVE family cell cycle protein [Blastocatellia bacterium]|nr:FtsW/RodA/SpoVE family cell cycle protein [Blastocatellia bacterium]